MGFVFPLILSSAAVGHHDGGGDAEAREAQRPMGNVTQLPGLPGHGRVLVPRGPRQPRRHGVQVPAGAPGPGRAAADPAGAVGGAGGHLTRAPGPTPPHGRGVRLRPGLPALHPGGDGVAPV